MTSPVRAFTDTETGDRLYPRLDGGNSKSVTSILGVMPKQMYLVPWSAKVVAEVAVEIMQDLFLSRVGDTQDENYLKPFYDETEDDYDWEDVAEYLKKVPTNERDDAGGLGDKVHDTANLILRSSKGNAAIAEAIFTDMVEKHEIDDSVADRIAHLITFLQDNEVKVVADEFTVYNDKYSYAGSCDVAMYINGEPYIIDLKTNKTLGSDIALQITAYAHGEYVVDDDGSKNEMPFSAPEGLTTDVKGGILHLQATQCRLVEVSISDEMFDCFLAFHLTKQLWFDRYSKTAMGSVLYNSKKKK
jgi:hypothetical protein